MRLSKTIITFILSSILFTATFSKANAEKLLAAIADWTGGEISCQVAVSILEDELGYEIDRIVLLQEQASGRLLLLVILILLVSLGLVMRKQTRLC